MSIEYADGNDGIRHITLSGRLDVAGAGQIETRLTALAATQALPIVLDLEAVEFLSSIGIRLVVSNAKAQRQRGGKLVVQAGQNAQVIETLRSTGIDQMVPLCTSLEAARAALLA